MILSGLAPAEHIQKELKYKISGFSEKPALAVLLVGEHAPSHTYVNVKKKACQAIGIEATLHTFSENVTLETLLEYIHRLNRDPHIHGILLQLPLPVHLPTRTLLEAIDPNKDVDGLHPINMGKLLVGISDGFVPCTPFGIQKLMEYYTISPQSKHVVIVGRSNIVGKPMAALLMQNARNANATVSVAHSYTHDLPALTRSADILIAAIGVPHFIKSHMVKEGAIVIDVGMNRLDDPKQPKGYRLVGDVDFESVKEKCAAITPVPKGVGPMTVAMLLYNTCLSYERSLS